MRPAALSEVLQTFLPASKNCLLLKRPIFVQRRPPTPVSIPSPLLFKFLPSRWARLVRGSNADLGWQARSSVREDSVPTSPCAPGRACSRAVDWLRASPGGSCSRTQGRGLAPAPDRAARSLHLFFRRSWERGRRREAPGGGDAARLCRSPSRCRAARTALPRSLALSPPSPPWGIFKTALLQFPPGRGCAAPGCAHTRFRAQRSRRLLNQEENRSAFFKAGNQRLPDASEPRRAPAPRSSARRSPAGLDLGEGLQRFQEFSILSRSRKVSKTDGQILLCHPLPVAKTWFFAFVI